MGSRSLVGFSSTLGETRSVKTESNGTFVHQSELSQMNLSIKSLIETRKDYSQV